MEKKTMGGLIAALRKTNGMTQRELAEKLNVSDKSISRWERDEGTPDLALIPVIAEIFGITCDELLRGECRPAGTEKSEATEKISQKSEKQLKYLLSSLRLKMKNRTLIVCTIVLAGFIAAMVCNFGFLRAIIGFFVGLLFIIAAVVCGVIFVNKGLAALDGDDFEPNTLYTSKRYIFNCSRIMLYTVTTVTGAIIPLFALVEDAYVGLSRDSCYVMAIGGVIGLLIGIVICFIASLAIFRPGVIACDPAQAEKVKHNKKIKRICAVVLIALLLVNLVITAFLSNEKVRIFSQGHTFDNAEDYCEFMETESTYEDYVENFYEYTIDEENENDYITEELCDADGNVICTYKNKNQSVSVECYGGDTNTYPFPITVYTFKEVEDANVAFENASIILGILSFAEILIVIFVYFKKRVK